MTPEERGLLVAELDSAAKAPIPYIEANGADALSALIYRAANVIHNGPAASHVKPATYETTVASLTGITNALEATSLALRGER